MKSGESVTQSVGGSFNTLNIEPSALLLASAHLPDECSSESSISVEQSSDRRALVNFIPVGDEIESSHPGDPLEDRESIPSSMTHSLDSKSEPAYVPSPRSHSSPGSDSTFSCHVDMEPTQDDILIPVASDAPGSSAGVPASSDVGDSEVVVRGVGEPSTSQPRIECPPNFLELKNISGMLWVPWDIIREECSVKDGRRLRQVEKHWRKCFHYGPNTLLGLTLRLILRQTTSWLSRVRRKEFVRRHLKVKVLIS